MSEGEPRRVRERRTRDEYTVTLETGAPVLLRDYGPNPPTSGDLTLQNPMDFTYQTVYRGRGCIPGYFTQTPHITVDGRIYLGPSHIYFISRIYLQELQNQRRTPKQKVEKVPENSEPDRPIVPTQSSLGLDFGSTDFPLHTYLTEDGKRKRKK